MICLPGLVGDSPAIRNVLEQVDKVAATDANVLILGENGTGKELVAREIHRRSSRRDEVFISVDLGSISGTLFESELFGHARGAFTDAIQDHTGRFEAASGGTLFFDEIGNLPLPLQVKNPLSPSKQEDFQGWQQQVYRDRHPACMCHQPVIATDGFGRVLSGRTCFTGSTLLKLKFPHCGIEPQIFHYWQIFSWPSMLPNTGKAICKCRDMC